MAQVPKKCCRKGCREQPTKHQLFFYDAEVAGLEYRAPLYLCEEHAFEFRVAAFGNRNPLDGGKET